MDKENKLRIKNKFIHLDTLLWKINLKLSDYDWEHFQRPMIEIISVLCSKLNNKL